MARPWWQAKHSDSASSGQGATGAGESGFSASADRARLASNRNADEAVTAWPVAQSSSPEAIVPGFSRQCLG